MARAAIGQICATASMKGNLEQCVRLVRQAANGGAKVLFLPEASDYIAPNGHASLDLAVPQSSSPFVQGLRGAAKQHGVAVHVGIHHIAGAGVGAGDRAVTGDGTDGKADTTTTTSTSLPQQSPETKRLLNRTLYITANGDIDDAGTYDKLHVFDYGSLRESATVQPGDRLTPPFETPVGRLGGLICFDLRFPEVSLALAQPSSSAPGASAAWGSSRSAQLLAYPSAFTIRTGEAHWEPLLRARAVECQAWVVAAAQVGRHNEKRASYGRSLVVDPWGRVVLRLPGVLDAEGNPEEGAEGAIGFVDVDLDMVEKTRAEMPLQRRRDVYSGL